MLISSTDDSQDEILDRETVWEDYRKELLAVPEEADQDLAATLDKLQLALDVAGLAPNKPLSNRSRYSTR